MAMAFNSDRLPSSVMANQLDGGYEYLFESFIDAHGSNTGLDEDDAKVGNSHETQIDSQPVCSPDSVEAGHNIHSSAEKRFDPTDYYPTPQNTPITKPNFRRGRDLDNCGDLGSRPLHRDSAWYTIDPIIAQNTSEPSPIDFVETIERFPDMIDGSARNVDVAGHVNALDLLRCLGGAKVQRVSQYGPHQAYSSLQIALRHTCFQLGKECPSVEELCELHRGDDSHERLITVAFEAGAPIQIPTDYLDLNTIVTLLRLLALREFQNTGQYRPYQLGILTVENDFLHARIHPKMISRDTRTVWLYFQQIYSPDGGVGTWYGICSDEAFGTPSQYLLPPQTVSVGDPTNQPFVFQPSAPPTTPPPRRYGGRTGSSKSSGSPHITFNSGYRVQKSGKKEKEKEKEKEKRKTAIQIQQLHNEFPAHYSPIQILNQSGDVLHYNNLLRVALWFGNKDIFVHLNGMRELENKSRHKALSAITKRIGVACTYIAEEHGMPSDVFRNAFNGKRAENNIPTRDTRESPGSGSEMASQTMRYRDQIGAALSKVLSGSPTSGLIKQRAMAPFLTRSYPTPNDEAFPADMADVRDVANQSDIMPFSINHQQHAQPHVQQPQEHGHYRADYTFSETLMDLSTIFVNPASPQSFPDTTTTTTTAAAAAVPSPAEEEEEEERNSKPSSFGTRVYDDLLQSPVDTYVNHGSFFTSVPAEWEDMARDLLSF